MKDFIQKYKRILIITTIVLFITIIVIPAFINLLFKLPAPIEFFEAEWQAADALNYYGAILSFLGTSLLSLLALWQNYKLNEANEKHTAQLEQMERDLNAPHIVIEDCVVIGTAYRLKFKIKNVSDNIAQDFCISDFTLIHSDGTSFWNSSEKYYEHYLGPSMIKKIELITPGITELDTILTFKISFIDIFGTKCERKAIGYFSDGIQNLRFIVQKQLS